MEEIDKEGSNDQPPNHFKPRTRSVKVKRRISLPKVEEEPYTQDRRRTYKIRKQLYQPISYIPSVSSLGADLEYEGKEIDGFLNKVLEKEGSLFQNIGPIDMYKTISVTQGQKEKQARRQSQQKDVNYYTKLHMIRTGQLKEQKQQERNLRKLLPFQKVQVMRQQRVLEKFARSQKDWTRQQEHLVKQVNREAENLTLNRGQNFREKMEDYDLISKTKDLDNHIGTFEWYMTLRTSDLMQDQKAAFLQISKTGTGLFTRVVQRPKSMDAVIRVPGGIKNTYRTSKADPYYQQQVNHEDVQPLRIHVEDIDNLYVQGFNKLQMEIEAAQAVGVEFVRPELVDPGDPHEEVIAFQYDLPPVQNQKYLNFQQQW